jgi:hypothetical protein
MWEEWMRKVIMASRKYSNQLLSKYKAGILTPTPPPPPPPPPQYSCHSGETDESHQISWTLTLLFKVAIQCRNYFTSLVSPL